SPPVKLPLPPHTTLFPYTTLFRSDHLGDDLGGLARFGGLLLGDRTLAGDVVGGHAFGVQCLGLHGGNVHGHVLADFFATCKVDQHANAAAMNVLREAVGRFVALEATNRHVLTDLANQRGAGGLDRAFTHGQFAERGNVGGRLFGNQAGQVVHEGDEVVVLGHEVGF